MFRYTIPILLLATYGLQAQQPCAAYHENVQIQLVKGSVAKPDRACVAKGGSVSWCSTDGDWAAAFPNRDKSPSLAGRTLYVGARNHCSAPDQVKPCKGTQPCRYKYAAHVDPSPAKDPDVEVQPQQ